MSKSEGGLFASVVSPPYHKPAFRRAVQISFPNVLKPQSKNSVLWLELLVWISGLAYLAFIDPAGTSHFSFCPLKNLGFEHCPGCGLGTSISFLFHGKAGESFSSHPLGLFTLIVLSRRIVTLAKPFFIHPLSSQKGFTNG